MTRNRIMKGWNVNNKHAKMKLAVNHHSQVAVAITRRLTYKALYMWRSSVLKSIISKHDTILIETHSFHSLPSSPPPPLATSPEPYPYDCVPLLLDITNHVGLLNYPSHTGSVPPTPRLLRGRRNTSFMHGGTAQSKEPKLSWTLCLLIGTPRPPPRMDTWQRRHARTSCILQGCV